MHTVLVLTLYLLSFAHLQFAFKLGTGENRFAGIVTVAEYLNMCQYRPGHKPSPSPEPKLIDCSEWRSLSCCKSEKAEGYLQGPVLGFDLNRCGQLPPECSRMFLREYCHAFCSPYLGPWLVQTHSKKFPERAYGMPLCQSDCNRWYDACRSGLTCARNWRAGGFNWTHGINECHPGFSCKRIDEVFTSAQDFCEQVWDGTWKVVPDSKHVWLDKDPQCLHFVGEDVASHNKLVAEHRAKMILDNLADVADKGIGTP